MGRKKMIFLTVILAVAVLFMRTLFYKTVFLLLLFLLWRKILIKKIPERYHRWTIRGIWIILALTLFVTLPRWRIHTNDRVQLVYFNANGDNKHAPIGHWLLNAVLPEAEIMNFGITGVRISALFGIHSDNVFVRQAQEDARAWKLGNFFKPYRHLGLNNPISGVYPQLFNEIFGTNHDAAYICRPKCYDSETSYPLVVFCHGYLGNWQLYQGVLKDLDKAVVISIGTRDLKGIFSSKDIDKVFKFYIPALERMGYRIDHKQIHMVGLSNGGSAISVAMRSGQCSKFKSLTSISCNLNAVCKIPCQINLIGGGKDGSSNRMPQQYRQLKNIGVDAALLFEKEENHFFFAYKREEITDFLKSRMEID